MKLVYTGKTKDVYKINENQVLLKFKDDVTGEDGVFDPGANTVGLTMEGAGKAALRLTTFFFEILKKENIPTHYISSDIENTEMTVVPATPFGEGLEVICRYRAVGSFLRRYGKYATEGQSLDAFVEITLKDDERNDPPISRDALDMLGILSLQEYESLKQMTQDISEIVKYELGKKGIELYDIKFEFGRDQAGNIILIDEISGGNMRAYKDGKYIEPLKLTKLMLEQ
ncbi:phosphoribosylaminoimidazolesuccinocarboxamide synthase [Cerasibacillus terrae]|uniref:Phosphoribosylaminoimidazole-succinocarboxamide synthase n=1 Tax=Cerasibacillus terrae TaxID=2498845 RepID=A0A5C8NZ18_9BACI|nr:phosphoribosylaminoimidazolesuccinocarboxamide synthase [Cerasibacillus terrae]TXL66514.1 phosphoribosylaminoimidazolesuccinocarboxamide synthase [Cerasibacillus terrae]